MSNTSFDKLVSFEEARRKLDNFRIACENYKKIFIEKLTQAIDEENTMIDPQFLYEIYEGGDKSYPGHVLHYGLNKKGDGRWMSRDLKTWENYGVIQPFRELQKKYLEEHGLFLQDLSDPKRSRKIFISISKTKKEGEALWHRLNIMPGNNEKSNEKNNEKDLDFENACRNYKDDFMYQIRDAIDDLVLTKEPVRPVRLDVAFLRQKYYEGVNKNYPAHVIHYGANKGSSHWMQRDPDTWTKHGVQPPFKELQKGLLEKGYFLQDLSDPEESRTIYIVIGIKKVEGKPLWHGLNII